MSEIGKEQPETAETRGRDAARHALERLHEACGLLLPLRRRLHQEGDRLEYRIEGVAPPRTARAVFEVERFVGGGFAGQVYRARLLELRGEEDDPAGLETGGIYALKILRPPTLFANLFRDLLYFLAFQSPFAARSSPAAVRVGVLWQKLIRRAAALELGDEGAVCDTYATFYDGELHAFGEVNEWVEGRIWKFEVDDRLFQRWQFDGEPPPEHNCPEYVHKKRFMDRLVRLMHEMGAPELARQYEWWSCKSQPNALKRLESGPSPSAGLTAIDFRAGLALLPLLPMSPADFRLILHGLLNGRLMQFDGCDLERLKGFVAARREHFADLGPALRELDRQDAVYRSSQVHYTRHHLKLLTDPGLRESIRQGTISAWRNLGRLDADGSERLRQRPGLFALLHLLSYVPFLGAFVVRLWGDGLFRRHWRRCLTRPRYLARSLRGARIGAILAWLDEGRLSAERALNLAERPLRFWIERLTVSWLPAPWHKALADPSWAWGRVKAAVRYALRFLREPGFREEVLLEQVRQGESDRMLTPAEADLIRGQVKDPFIQKYLRCLAVHVCTVPVTQAVMVLAAAAVTAYCVAYRQLSWAESMALGAAAAAAIQLMPISPGSITRGVFVLYLMVRERDIRNYYIAAPISFLHVIGYLAFPLQMVAHNPALARFLAGRWTKQTVHMVPVFGESGALLEHGVFDLFFNLPISVSRGLRRAPGRWIAGLASTAAAAALLLLGLWVGIWEWRQPVRELEAAAVASVERVERRAGDLPFSTSLVRLRLEGLELPVEAPASCLEAEPLGGAPLNARLRRLYPGNRYRAIELTPPGAGPAGRKE